MKIMITAGGTSERIDDVRTITNSSTGRLGYAVGKAFAEKYRDDIEKIYYLHGKRASYPDYDNIEPVEIEGVADLQEAMERILKADKIDAVIHAMAVSDYVVKQGKDGGESGGLSGNKISSDIDDLVIHMKRSPKVIGKIKGWSEDSVLVGFKLLSGVPHEELIDVGFRLMEKNGCDFVLANDLREIGSDFHKGYLIHKDRTYDIMETNEEIADMIALRVISECRTRI